MNGYNLHHTSDRKLIQELVNHYQQGSLNLEPGFQRDSVWREKDRAKLNDSIIRNYPLPAIFLYRRNEDGHLVYDVIDGKQRLESIFMFMGVLRGQFWVKVPLPGVEGEEWMNWKRFCKKRLQHLITGYSIPTIEVDGGIHRYRGCIRSETPNRQSAYAPREATRTLLRQCFFERG